MAPLSIFPDLGDRLALTSFPLYRGDVLENAEESLGQLYAPAGQIHGTIRPAAQERSPSGVSTIAGVRLSNLTLASIRLGERSLLSIAPQNAYHLALPIRGDVWCYFGARKVRMTPGMVAVTQPHDPVLIPAWGEDAEVLCIQIRPGALEGELSRLLGRPVGMPRLEGDLDLRSGPGRSWGATVDLLLSELADHNGLFRSQHGYGEDIEHLVIAALLRAMPHEYSSELERRTPQPRWRSVKRATDAIEAAPEEQWTLPGLAQIAGVGARRLQQGFSEQLGIPPIAYVQMVRYRRVREELLTGADSVGQTALRWGFTHLGRFSAGYRARYGETPRETQRNGQATAERLSSHGG